MPGEQNQIYLQKWLAGLVASNYMLGDASVAITDAYANVITLNIAGGTAAALGVDPYEPQTLPNRNALLQWLQAPITTIANGATSIDWFLSLDVGGGNAITPETTTSILLIPGSAVAGTASASLRDGGMPFIRPRAGDGTGAFVGVDGALHLFVKSTQAAGTLNILRPKLYWTGPTPQGVGATPLL